MKYYLGYYNNSEFKPIELENTEPTILSIVKFTTNFDSIMSLKQYLLEEEKIPNNEASLHYLIEKGKKGDKYYEPLKANKIYTLEYTSLFTLEGLKKFINENKYSKEMITILFSEYLRKYGYIDVIARYFKEKEFSQLIPILSGLSKVTSLHLNSKIKHVIDNYPELSKEEISSFIDYIINCLKYSNHDLINAYIYLLKSINFKNIPTIKYLHNWFSIVNDYNQSGERNYIDTPSEFRDINVEVDAFFNSIIYDYDSKKREYKKLEGKRKIQSRQLFDLSVILSDYYKHIYDEYLNSIYSDDESYDEDAEFLCQDDFERIGTTPEETGIKIRRISK